MIHKVSLENSQGRLEKLLTKFVDSDYTLLLLIANMQEISPRMVNHLRIMIEEAESKIKNCSKLFVCLLHFPPVMFYQSCYPTLFLQGWGHHYLDTMARGTLTRAGVKAIVDVKTWLYHCCFPETVPSATNDDYFVKGLQNLLEDAIPVIASRVDFISLNENETFRHLDASQGTRILKELLNQKGLGRILCSKFRIYWTPKVMVEHIKRVSMFMYDQESTLNITDSTQSIVRSSFFDFLIYMFIKMNEELYINIIRDENCPAVVNELFEKLLQALQVPELMQLKVLAATLRPQCDPQKVKHHPKFPFFKYICEMVEKVVDESREEVNQKINIQSEEKIDVQEVNGSLFLMQRRSRQQVEEIYKDVVISRLKENLKKVGTM